ncbi:MAG TPA: glycosyltransferase family 87 protein [Sphingomicrobium sp.]
MTEHPSVAKPTNRSVAIQLWAIGALGPLIYFSKGEIGKNDFVALWIAGKQLLSGNVVGIYDLASTGQYTALFDLGQATIFPYPPHALFLIAPFSMLPQMSAYLVWTLGTAAFFWWCARPYFRTGVPSILSIMTPAAISTIAFGQTGLLFGGLWILAFRGKWPAVALLTIKPHLGFLAILSLRSRSDFLKTALLAAALVVVSALMFGVGLWASFFDHTIAHAIKISNLNRWFFAGVTPAIGYGFWGWLPFAAAGALMLCRNVNLFTVSTASFLISPYGFHYDMTVASMGFGLLIASHWQEMPIRHRIPVALGFLSPAIAITGAWWIPPLLLWALWTQVQYPEPSPTAKSALETARA